MAKVNSRRKFWLGLGLVTGYLGNPLLSLGGGVAIATLSTVSLTAPATAATLTAWRFDASSRQLEITVPEGTTPRYFLLAQPARIVVDLPNTDMGAVPEQQSYTGAIRQIRVNQFQPGLTRIVIELAPNTELQPEQVAMQRVGSGTSDRWVLRPLIAGDVAIATPSSPAIPPTPSVPPTPSTPAIPPSAAIAPPLQPVPSLSSAVPVLDPSPAPAIATPPPLEPGATEIPVELPTSETAIAPSPTPTPTAIAPAVIEPPSNRSTRATATTLEGLPPATLLGDRPVTVTVPPLSGTATRPEQNSARPANVTPTVPSAAVNQFPPRSESTTADSTVVAFGQPLPDPSANGSDLPTLTPAPLGDLTVNAAANVLIPEGAVLSLRYPGETLLEIEPGEPWQEVLVLSQAIRDRSGTIIASEGSPVIGQFELGNRGIRFVARAITIQGRNILLNAASERMHGDRYRSRNSARQAAVIQPSQIVEVRVLQNVSPP